MKQSLFLSIAAIIALAVGAFALLAPAALLASKGVSSAAASVWTQEVGVLLIAIGVIVFSVRNHADSPTLQAVLNGNAIVQLGLLPIEVLAYREGTITQLSGIVPNSVLHLCLAVGFLYYATTMKLRNKNRVPSIA
jgi:hypothetical protein